MENQNKGISRRSFFGGVGVLAAGALAASTVGCAPKNSSNAKESASSEANKADGAPSWLGEAPQIDESEITETLTTDLIIVGAGNGGMAASAYAAQEDIDFMVFESGSAVSGTRSWFAAVDSPMYTSQGITVDRQRLLGEIARYSSGSANQGLIKMFMDESADMFTFVNDIMTGCGMAVVTQDYEMPNGMGGTPFYTPPFEHMCTSPDKETEAISRNDAFEAYINGKGHEVNYAHKLAKLVQDETGKVVGAIFRTRDDTYVKAVANKGVLLATGGYVNNAEMLQELSPITVASVVMTTSEPGNDGWGQKAAMWAGAKRDAASATMIFDRGWVDPGTPAGYKGIDDSTGAPVWPSNIQINAGTQPFLKVNNHGERFVDESADYDYIAHAAAHQPNGTYFSVWDAGFAADINRFGTLGCAGLTKLLLAGFKKDDGTYDLDEFFKLPIQGDGNVLKADTLEELADLMLLTGDDKVTFLATVERYNQLNDAQNDEDFFKEAYRLSSIKNPPYYAASLGGRLLTTLDGIRINENCQALGENFEPIEGLYCCGDCSGSVFSGCYPDQLHGLACGRTMTEALHVVKLMK